MMSEALFHDPIIYRETALVRCAIKRLGLQSRLSEFHAAVEYQDPDAARDKRLTFDAFHAVVDPMPIRFASPPATGYFTASDGQVADLVTSPQQARLVHLHAETRALLGLKDELPFGLVFRHGGTPGGHVLHDGALDRFGDGVPVVTDTDVLVMSRFYTVLDHVAGGLTNVGGPQRVPVPAAFDPGLPIRPSVRRRLGNGAEAHVYGLIQQLCTRQLPERLYPCSRWFDGERWALITQPAMAELIGCSPSAVKRSLASLVTQKMIERRRTTEGNAYRCTSSKASRERGAR